MDWKIAIPTNNLFVSFVSAKFLFKFYKKGNIANCKGNITNFTKG